MSSEQPPQQQQQQHEDGSSARLCCSWLLELPGPALEEAFWRDELTRRTYATADLFTATTVLLGNIMAAKVLAPALTAATWQPGTWQVPARMVLNVGSALLALLCILRHPKVYLAHRHRFAAANRLLRLAMLAFVTLWCTPAAHGAMGHLVRLSPERAAGKSEGLVALLNLTRSLCFVGIISAAQGDWNSRWTRWLPLQVLTFVLTCHGSLRQQPCRLANEPHSAMILQATCRSVSELHHLVFAAVLGPGFMPQPGDGAEAACSDLYTAARVVTWYSHAAHIVIVPACAFFLLEWQIKARWCKARLSKDLIYEPWLARGSSDQLEHQQQQQQQQQAPLLATSGWLTPAAVTTLGVTALLWLTWLLALALVPLLPHEPCPLATTAALAPAVAAPSGHAGAGGACRGLGPFEGLLCHDPGLTTALVMYVQVMSYFWIKLSIFRRLHL